MVKKITNHVPESGQAVCRRGTAVNMKPFIFCEGFCADRSVSAVGNAGCLETVRPEGCIHL
ncbi:UNVERIFIED_ORG: hypothetical protein B5F06_12640 [Lacrimispora saccharolytica]|nr:hypothetical protein DW757_09440 [Clostridium sp. AM29-11AC]CBL37123.1 hypothetical protein CL3_35130 [butyrate-producing bacterium SM4/1]